jgi:hypothetical protein
MIPSLGRTVHYVLPSDHKHAGQHRAATISQVWSDNGKDADEATPVHLHVMSDTLNDLGTPIVFIAKNVTQDPMGRQPNSWHEPERAKVAKGRAQMLEVEKAEVAA